MSETRKSEGGERSVRRDIQGLRALAVSLVLVFHLWPKALPGGFVGVDAFFVVSGYLISAHLLRELETTGTIRLAEFWAKRARRLLPASLTVLAVCLLITWAWVPLSLWRDSLKSFAGATAYSLNWLLAFDSVDYWAAEDDASPVQHFWSLSVEEQFYLLWPIFLVLAALGAARARARAQVWARGILSVIVIGSLGASVLAAREPGPADYFVTWSRAWEFGAGALLAFVDPKPQASRARGVVGVLGAALLCAAAFLLSDETSYPGWTALLPVCGTVAAIAFGQERTPFCLDRLLAARPIQWVGDASYSIYLWHWPLIVFSAELPDGWRGSGWQRAWIVPATFGLAWLSKRYVEDTVRYGNLLASRSPRLTFAWVLLAMGALGGGILGLYKHQARLTTQRHPWAEMMSREALPCFGAHREDGCVNPDVQGKLFPEPWAALADRTKTCMANNQGDVNLRVCKRGYLGRRPRFQTAIVGDSHAGHWSAAFEQGAEDRKERILHMLKGSCPFTMFERDGPLALRRSCEVIKQKIWAELRSRTKIRRIVLSASSINGLVTRPGLEEHESAVRGYEEMLRALPAHIREVIVVRDVPRPERDVIQCLERLPDTAARLLPGACARAREEALVDDPLADAALRVRGRVHLLDFTDVLCDSNICSPVVGNVLAYRDGHHLTATFAQSVGPRIRRALAKFSKR